MKICRNASIECVVIYSLFRQDCDMIIFISFCMYSWYKWIYDLLHWHIHTYWAAVSFLQPFQVWAFSEWHFRIRVASPRLLWNITPPPQYCSLFDDSSRPLCDHDAMTICFLLGEQSDCVMHVMYRVRGSALSPIVHSLPLRVTRFASYVFFIIIQQDLIRSPQSLTFAFFKYSTFD